MVDFWADPDGMRTASSRAEFAAERNEQLGRDVEDLIAEGGTAGSGDSYHEEIWGQAREFLLAHVEVSKSKKEAFLAIRDTLTEGADAIDGTENTSANNLF